SLIEDGNLDANRRLLPIHKEVGRSAGGADPYPQRAKRQVEKVQPKDEEQHAGRREYRDRDEPDQLVSNNVYGRMVARTNATRASASGRLRRVHCMYRRADSPSMVA